MPSRRPFGPATPCDSLAPVACDADSAVKPAPLPERATATSSSRPGVRRFAAASSLALSVLAVAVLSQAAPADQVSRTAPGAPSWKYSESGAAMRWHEGTARIVLDPSVIELGSEGEDAVRAAIGAWVETDARLPQVSFERSAERGSAKRDGVNRVLFAPIDVPGHEDDLAITMTYSDADSGAIIEADIIINAKHDFTQVKEAGDDEGDDREYGSHTTCEHTYDLQSVATHEFGHFFGLGEDTDDAEASMYFSTSRCETKKRSLSSVDSVEMVSLYETTTDEPEPGVGCSFASRPNGSGYLGLIAVGALLAFACRRR